jgi:hypothetical protein
MADVDISVGADTSAAQTGLAELRNMATGAVSDLKGMFLGTFAEVGL